MKIVLETKKGTKERETELKKFKGYLTRFFENDDNPFNCNMLCDDKDCKECIKEYIEERTEEIDKEGVWYL